MKELKINAYIVKYNIMEGNNYAGGWVEHEKIITSADDLYYISNINSVTPVNITKFDQLTQDEIFLSVNMKKKKVKAEKIQRDIEYAEDRLKQARAKVI